MSLNFNRDLVLLTGLQKQFYANLAILKKLQDLKPDELFSFHLKDFLKIGIKDRDAEYIISREVLKSGEDELKKAEKANILIIPNYSVDFPSTLKGINYCPFVIYLKGKKEALKKPSISIVGTRNCSSYGKTVTESLSFELSRRGLVIVSGLARGIDTVAHSAAVEKGETIAVLGSGVDRIYPSENNKLAKKIEERGAIISEFPIGTRALPYHFPLRNRIISGLSFITVVVEASEKSGALITAKWALDQGRDVLAVPGAITSKESKGTNFLLKHGAKPILSWEDVWEEIPSYIRDKLSDQVEESKPELTSDEEKILSLIPIDSEITIDELSIASGLQVYEIFPILFQLELKGLIIENSSKSYQRRIR